MKSLRQLFDWTFLEYFQVSESAEQAVLSGHFHEYLVRGAFPNTLRAESVAESQRILREQVVDRILKRDMSAFFGVRDVLDLELCFLFLCMRDGEPLDLRELCAHVKVSRPTAERFLDLLETAGLIRRISPMGYGRSIRRRRARVYLADAALAPALLLKGKSLLEDPVALEHAIQTAVVNHLALRLGPDSSQQGRSLSYDRGQRGQGIDLVGEFDGKLIPFELKDRTEHLRGRRYHLLYDFCSQKRSPRGYRVTRTFADFGPAMDGPFLAAPILHIPAALLCLWASPLALRASS